MNDLVSLFALSAPRSGDDASQVGGTLLDVLLRVLDLDFVYLRLTAPVGATPIEMARLAEPPQGPAASARALGDLFRDMVHLDPRDWPASVRDPAGGDDVAIAARRLGAPADIGIVVAGSRRADFPQQMETLLLGVAANQAAVGLQEARLLGEQKRAADRLEHQVAQRTAELSAVNEQLRREVAERKRAEDTLRTSEVDLRRLIADSIPEIMYTLSPAGEVEYLNRSVLQYFGRTSEELKNWATTDAIHPDDLPAVLAGFAHSITTGSPLDVEHRSRRADGVYRWFHDRALPVYGADGDITGWYGLLIDIDDRKRAQEVAEEALRRSEHNARLIVDSIPGLVAIMTSAGEIGAVNSQLVDYCGRSLDELRHWGTSDVVHAADLPAVAASFGSAIAAGASYDFEARIRRHDGVYRWFQVRGSPFRDTNGTILSWYVLLTDIDERKRAEEAVSASERNLNEIINTIPALAWSARTDGSAEFFNQHYLDYVGLSAEQAQGWGWSVAVHPDDLNGLAGTWQTLMPAGRPGGTEARLRRFDGEFRWFLFRFNPLRDASGTIVKWYGTNTDIDDLKRAEKRLRRSEAFLADAQRLSRTGSFSWLPDTDEMTLSDEAYRILEFEISTPLSFAQAAMRIHPEDRLVLAEQVAQARAGLADHDWDLRLQMPDDRIKYLHIFMRRSGYQIGRLGYRGTIQDVTERRLAEAALGKLRSELAHVTRVSSLGAMTASIAHEVNQPLAGIVTNASTCLRMLAAEPPNTEGAREAARRGLRDGNRAADVIKRLRALFSKQTTTIEPVDLNEAAREVIALSASDLQRGRVALRTEFADGLPAVAGDRVQLQQVILNLLRNAADAMSGIDDRPRQLVIKTEAEENDHVRLIVQDSGVGLGPEGAERIFEAFYTTKSEGMGIGLAVSRSIIESHGGRLWAASNDGAGATFSFAIPEYAEAEGRAAE